MRRVNYGRFPLLRLLEEARVTTFSIATVLRQVILTLFWRLQCLLIFLLQRFLKLAKQHLILLQGVHVVIIDKLLLILDATTG